MGTHLAEMARIRAIRNTRRSAKGLTSVNADARGALHQSIWRAPVEGKLRQRTVGGAAEQERHEANEGKEPTEAAKPKAKLDAYNGSDVQAERRTAAANIEASRRRLINRFIRESIRCQNS